VVLPNPHLLVIISSSVSRLVNKQLSHATCPSFACTGKIDELAATSGLVRAQALEQKLQQAVIGSCSGMVLPDAFLLYSKAS